MADEARSGRARLQAGIDRTVRVVTRVYVRAVVIPPVGYVKEILDRYGAAGGDIMARSLAFSTLFALIPGFVLLISIAFMVLGDSQRVADLVDFLAQAFPPLAPVLGPAVDEIVGSAPGFSIIGLIGLIWGASSFYAALDEALARLFDGRPRRSGIQQRILGAIGVAIAAVAFALVIAAFTTLTVLSQAVDVARPDERFLLQVGSILVITAGTIILIRFVPARAPRWRAIVPPAIGFAVVFDIFTRIFVILAPRMLGAGALFGSFVALFAALLWMMLSYQLFLRAATWVHVRELRLQGAIDAEPGRAEEPDGTIHG